MAPGDPFVVLVAGTVSTMSLHASTYANLYQSNNNSNLAAYMLSIYVDARMDLITNMCVLTCLLPPSSLTLRSLGFNTSSTTSTWVMPGSAESVHITAAYPDVRIWIDGVMCIGEAHDGRAG